MKEFKSNKTEVNIFFCWERIEEADTQAIILRYTTAQMTSLYSSKY